MEWNPEKQHLLENYITNYSRQLNDTGLFYKNLDWNYIFNLVGVDDQEFLMLKIDEIYDESINVYFKDEFNINQLVDHWKSKSNPIYQEVVQIVESLGLDSFKLEVPEESSSNKTTTETTTKTEPLVTTPTTAKRVSYTPVPKLTKTERRLSLDLMHPRPSFGLNQESQLVKPPIASTTNIHVHAQQETASHFNPSVRQPSKKKFTFHKSKFTISTNRQQQQQQQTNTAPRQRRTSTVDEQLPLYIRNQLTKNRPQQTITPKPSKHHFIQNASPANSSPRGSYKRSSRIQNLLTNSQSLYVHSKDPANSAETSTPTSNDTDLQLRYYSDELDDEDNREYILPDLLTRYFGVHEDHEIEEDTDEDADDDSEEEEEEEENDFVNVGDDHDDYLFKI